MPNIYAFGDEETLKQAILSIERFMSFVQGGGGGLGNNSLTQYMEVTDIVSDQEVKGIQKVWDSSLDPPAYAAPEGTAITWDSDLFPGSTNYLEPNVFTDTSLSVGDVVEVIFYMDKSFTSRWKARIGGGSAGIFILKITAPGANINTYTASVIDNRTDQTVIETGVTLKALDHSDGTFPNGVILTCSFDKINSFYEPTNYPVFMGS